MSDFTGYFTLIRKWCVVIFYSRCNMLCITHERQTWFVITKRNNMRTHEQWFHISAYTAMCKITHERNNMHCSIDRFFRPGLFSFRIFSEFPFLWNILSKPHDLDFLWVPETLNFSEIWVCANYPENLIFWISNEFLNRVTQVWTFRINQVRNLMLDCSWFWIQSEIFCMHEFYSLSSWLRFFNRIPEFTYLSLFDTLVSTQVWFFFIFSGLRVFHFSCCAKLSSAGFISDWKCMVFFNFHSNALPVVHIKALLVVRHYFLFFMHI